ncbi:MAG TPA: DUF2079 domain-containing protein [Candidatus Baltobacteraceae bacterium]|nr:DUF2079 domain-containing protein [Candidatus Baltobacteraceae bacterium]
MRRPLGAAVMAVIAVMSALMVIRWNLWSFGTDTGTFAQIALNAFKGFTDGPEMGTHFHFHWSPILAVLWPVAAATRSPLSIQIVQVVLIALCALPLAAIVRAYAGDEWGTRVGVLALIYPPLLSVAFEEFHELAFYPVLALSLLWAADRARWLWFALFSLALVLIREDACVDLVVIGIALGIIGLLKRRGSQTGLLAGEPIEPERLSVAGFGLALLSAAVLALYAYVIVPRAGGWAPSHFYQYPFASGPVQTALSIVTHPLALARATVTFGRFTYLLEAFAPLAFLPMFTRWTWLALPGFAGVLLASDSIVWRMGFHYSLLWAPWLLLAAAWALARMARSRGESVARRWWVAAISICAVVLIAFDPMHPVHYLTQAPWQQPANILRAFACVPREAAVATHDEWYTHIALRYPHSTNMGDGVGRFNGYVVYTPAWRNEHVDTRLLPQLAAAQNDGRFTVVCRYGDVLVLRPRSRTAE